MIMKEKAIFTYLTAWVLSCTLVILIPFDLKADENTEYSYVSATAGNQGYQQYLNELGIPRLYLVSKSSENNKIHWTEVIDRNNRVLKKFSDNYSVSSLGEGRYDGQAMLLVTSVLKECKKNCRQNYLFRSDFKISKTQSITEGGMFDSLVLKDGNFMSLTHYGLQIQDIRSGRIKTIPAPVEITDGIIGSNIDGQWMATAVTDQGEVLLADETGWSFLNLILAAHGDRNGILSIYPQSQDKALIAIYRYINEYNKGLYLVDYDMNTKTTNSQGWLFNSEDRNIGFDPDIYFNKKTNKVIVSAKNSSKENEYVHFPLPTKLLSGLQAELPEHVLNSGFGNEKAGSFMMGGGISQVGWAARSKVEKNDITYTDVDYLIADSIFLSANFEARIGDTSLTINYLQNRAEQLADDEIDDAVSHSGARFLTKEASSYLFSTIDFQGMLGASSSLRLMLERGKTKGVAEVNELNQDKIYSSFTTQYDRIGLLNMQERGFYFGGDYVNYAMPSAVGFSDNTAAIAYSGYDPDFEFSTIRFVTGYDALAYARRYETNYSRWYWAGGINLGLGWASLSSQLEDDAKQKTGKTEVASLPLFFAIGGELEFGYIWQKRSKTLGGAGYSTAVGYKLNGNYLAAGQGNDTSNDQVDSLFLEFSRSDLFYGPFFKANIIF